jgi:hypothetical protein
VFLKDLSKEEKEVFMFLADQICKADEILHKKEAELMDLFAAETDVQIPVSGYSDEKAFKMIANFPEKTKKAFYVELTAMAYVDKFPHENEIKYLEKMKEAMGLSEEIIEGLDDWVDAFVAVVALGYRLVDDVKF